MIVLGIDIGLTGAVAALRPDGAVELRDLLAVEAAGGQRLCGRALRQALLELVPAGDAALVVAEDVRPRPQGNGGRHGNSMSSQGSLMRSRGIVEAVLDVLGWRVAWIQPQVWKRRAGLLGADKGTARALAVQLYPAAEPALRRVKDHNRADALLLARHGRLHLT